MKKTLTLLIALVSGYISYGQLVNDGGTIVIKPGATLYVESDVTNNIVGASNGTITVEGTLEVQGDLTNNANMTTIAGSLVKFSGTANSDFKSNGAVIENMQMAKDDAATGTVTLVDSLTINTNLDFEPSTNGNKLVLGTKDVILAQDATTVTDPTANDYIVADGTGMVEKVVTADGNFLFPIGDASDYSPVDVAYTSGTTTYTDAKVRSNVVNAVHPNKPTEADDYISRYWNVNQSGIGSYGATLTGTYVAGDLTGVTDDVFGATQMDGAVGMEVSDWTFSGAGSGMNTVVSDVVTDDTDLTGINFFGKANLKVFLQGAYSGGTMTTTLPGLASFPLTTPYAAAPWNAPSETAASVPAGTTDWILVEARDAATPSTVLAQKSGFVKNDGTIVDLDGGSLYLKDVDPSSIIAIKHRNHLGVRTNAGVDLTQVSPDLFDFSQDTALYTNGAIANAKMKDLGGGDFGMWAGDVDANNKVRYLPLAIPPTPSDALSILSTGLGGVPNSTFNGYSNFDVNFDGKVRYLPLAIPPTASDALYLLSNSLGGITNSQLTAHN